LRLKGGVASGASFCAFAHCPPAIWPCWVHTCKVHTRHRRGSLLSKTPF
jgi:hypothetical protein